MNHNAGTKKRTILEVMSIIVSIFGVITAIALFNIGSKDKLINYNIISYSISGMVDRLGVPSDRLKLYFDNKLIKSINLFLIDVSNEGDVEIRPEDFEHSLVIKYPETSRILHVETDCKNPPNLSVTFEEMKELHLLTVKPLLLNKGDSFCLRLYVAQEDKLTDPDIDARIAGTEVLRVSERDTSLSSRLYFVTISASLAVSILTLASLIYGLRYALVLSAYKLVSSNRLMMMISLGVGISSGIAQSFILSHVLLNDFVISIIGSIPLLVGGLVIILRTRLPIPIVER